MAARMSPYRGKIAVDGESAQHGSVILMSIGNGRLAGGGIPWLQML